MNKKLYMTVVLIIVVAIGAFVLLNTGDHSPTIHTLEGTILSKSENTIMIKDANDVTYTFDEKDVTFDVGSKVVITYTGLLNKNAKLQEIKLIEGKDVAEDDADSDEINPEWLDDGLFSKYYTLAFRKLQTMSLDEKVAQVLLVRYPDSDQKAIDLMKKYQFGGYVLFARDFNDKTEEQVKKMTSDVQNVMKIPALMAVDEEGGTVVRVSSNPNLRTERFKAPSEIYKEGGLDAIKSNTIEKSELLNRLGLNVNLAPVVDVTTSPSDYMYSRSLQQNTDITSNFAKTVIEASKGTGVSYTLKHFPGYGNNADTHTSGSTDSRSYESILKNDIPPFESGIAAGAESVLVSHNTVTNIDKSNPASLSSTIHDLLRDELNFTGVIITDDLDMGAVSQIDNVVEKAIAAGNDMLIVTDYENDFNAIKKAIQNGNVKEDVINKAAFKVIAWKYYKGLIYDNQK